MIGLQFGGKWTEGTGMTENAPCIDGRVSKISQELEWGLRSVARAVDGPRRRSRRGLHPRSSSARAGPMRG